MQFTFSITNNLNLNGAMERVQKAAKQSLKDIVITVAKDAIENSPNRTGNNRRSIMYEMGSSEPVQPNKGPVVNQTNTDPGELGEYEGAVYGTSGYSGWLEVGTSRMPARPYLYPALTERFTLPELAGRIKANLGE